MQNVIYRTKLLVLIPIYIHTNNLKKKKIGGRGGGGEGNSLLSRGGSVPARRISTSTLNLTKVNKIYSYYLTSTQFNPKTFVIYNPINLEFVLNLQLLQPVTKLFLNMLLFQPLKVRYIIVTSPLNVNYTIYIFTITEKGKKKKLHCFFFFKEFQPIKSIFDDSLLSSNEDTNQFFM